MSNIEPTRRLKAPEKKAFDRAREAFPHLRAEDAELLTAFAEQSNRYATAKHETENKPTITTPIFSRSNGTQIGERPVRNPAFANMREALTQVRLLERRLTTLNDKRRVEAEREDRRKAKPKPLPTWASERARAMAAYDLMLSVEAEIIAGTFEVTDERVEDLMQQLVRVGLTLAPGSDELREAALGWIEQRYWGARGEYVTLTDESDLYETPTA
jgi:hypothetical protein